MDQERVLIIAEAGINHNGSVELAKDMVEAAARAGADIIKFQTFRAEKLVSRNAQKAQYQKAATGAGETQQQMLRKLELSYEDHIALIEHCRRNHIRFLSTPFDEDSIELLDSLGMELYKIPSGEITNYPYLRQIAQKKKQVILSTGMSTMEEIGAAVAVLRENGTTDISLLHCNTQYPTPMKDVNLRAMCTMREEFNLPVGYSDHTKGIEVPVAAVAMGACIIEKHFTMDRAMEGPDHRASLEPDELKAMVQAVRNIEAALGDGKKHPSESELENIPVARKSIVARTSIQRGDVFTEENITTKRPGGGISPMRWKEVLGRQAGRDYSPDDMIE